MKNKRQTSKEQTLNKIVEVTRQLIIQQGIITLNTVEIAKTANIAHGTIFAHFASKELLISHICQQELKKIALKLRELSENQSNEINNLLDKYLNLLAENEDFFVVISKDFPFLNPDLQKTIISNESIVRNILYQHIENGIKNGIYKNVDITMSLSFLIGCINLYLGRKEYFVTKTSIILEKKEKLIQTFLEILIP
jgi:AcrR family transcriptional regulator